MQYLEMLARKGEYNSQISAGVKLKTIVNKKHATLNHYIFSGHQL